MLVDFYKMSQDLYSVAWGDGGQNHLMSLDELFCLNQAIRHVMDTVPDRLQVEV